MWHVFSHVQNFPPDTALGGFASFGGKPQGLGMKSGSQNLTFYPSFFYRKMSVLYKLLSVIIQLDTEKSCLQWRYSGTAFWKTCTKMLGFSALRDREDKAQYKFFP